MMNFFERRERRAGSGQNPLPENMIPPHMRSFGNERPPIETRKPPVNGASLKKAYDFSVEVPAKFTDLYGTELSIILKREKVSWGMIETFSPPAKIHVKMIAEPVRYEAIKREIEESLGLTVRGATE